MRYRFLSVLMLICFFVTQAAPAKAAESVRFSDVDASASYAEAIQWAAAGKSKYSCKDFVVRICFPYPGNSRCCCKQFLPFFNIKGIIQMDSDKSLT